ncbi:IS110 family transposase [Labrenzia sp. OB1]|uniref:IS110 family transposase n=1 Tax=Labrenzia sp. OB1 TaxID=1561204 RepID=UPI001FCC284C|nr:IS110 family transposase [Labrenzia sp. OB1]
MDVAWPRADKSTRFTNDREGFVALKRWLGAGLPELVVYEATGAYHSAFELAFSGQLPLHKINPLQARRFAQACGLRAKTDKVDAAMLAAMGATLDMEPDPVVSKEHYELKELQIERTALIKDRTRLKNRLKTQILALTRRQTKARLAQIERQLKAIDGEIETRIEQDRPRALDILKSIPGIGSTTAAAILIECPEIGSLGRKQIASLAGLAPMTRQSGQWRGTAFIQGGRKFLRDALYMPALVTSKFNPDMAAKYKAMRRERKPEKVALTAIMRKLIELANTLIKQNRTWTQKPA